MGDKIRHQSDDDVLEHVESPAAGEPVIVVRYSGTLGTKASNVRSRFAQKIRANINHALELNDLEAELWRDWDRLYVEPASAHGLQSAAEPLRRVAGVQSVRPSFRLAWSELDDIVDACTTMWRQYLDDHQIETFAVRAQRVGDRSKFPFTSPEASRAIGAALDINSVSVDLDEPDVEVGVEIHADDVYLFGADLPGPGGLPIGVEGRALALVSGGFDSAVAAQQMYRRGIDLDYVYFQLSGRAHRRGVRKALKQLVDNWGAGSRTSLTVVDFRPVIAEIRETLNERHWQLALKRWMYRAAETIATEHLTDSPPQALVTGEVIGQVSTQTLTNLVAIEAAIDRPVLRPLISINKENIVDMARDIGIADIAGELPEPCALQGGHQVTECPPERLDRIESKLDDSVLQAVLEQTERHDPRKDPAPADESIQVEHVPDQAVPVDLRPESAYEQWHPPDALHVPFDVAVEQGAALPEKPTYLFYCDAGLKSAHVAEQLRKLGFNAYSFDGGIEDLKLEMSFSG